MKARINAAKRTEVVQPKHRLGILKGRIKVPDDIKTPFAAEIEEMFYGGELEPQVDKSSRGPKERAKKVRAKS